MNAFTNIEKTKLWKTYKKCPTEKVARIAIDVEKVYRESKKPLGYCPMQSRGFWRKKKEKEAGQWCYLGEGSPMHIAIREGYFDVFQLIFNNTNEKNPTDAYGYTVLHVVAEKGLLEICKMIMGHLDDKNPKSLILERTPLHAAASGGHLQICELIMNYLDDKNPSDCFGETPLHMAARYGQFKACQLFIKNVTNKNPKDRWEKTPMDLAEKNGHKLVCQLLQEGMSFFQIFRSNLRCRYHNLWS